MDVKSIIGRTEISVREDYDTDDYGWVFIIEQKRYEQSIFNRVKVKDYVIAKLPAPYKADDEDHLEARRAVDEYVKIIVKNRNAVFVGKTLIEQLGE